jgi:MFS family permease
MVLVAAPKFIEDTLDSSPENAIYIASPGAIGLALGLMVTPALSRVIGVRVLSVVGYVFFAGVLACLPFIHAISGPVLDTLYWWNTVTSKAGLSPEIATTLVLLPFAGFGSSVIQVSSRAAVYARIHPGLIGQVLATQAALGSVTAVIPTFIAGGLLDLLPVEAFLAGLTAVTIGAAVLATLQPDEEQQQQVSR